MCTRQHGRLGLQSPRRGFDFDGMLRLDSERSTLPKATSGMIDFEALFRLRVAVGRYGEMDCASWWNTKGQLGKYGAAALRRGFPRTHWFAQARSVFAVAAKRCEDTYSVPGSVTLWRLEDQTEEEFEALWETWTDRASAWCGFFESVAPVPDLSLKEYLLKLGLITEEQVELLARLKRTAGGRAAQLSSPYTGVNRDIRMLALGFDLAGRSELLVPYAVPA